VISHVGLILLNHVAWTQRRYSQSRKDATDVWFDQPLAVIETASIRYGHCLFSSAWVKNGDLGGERHTVIRNKNSQ